MLRPRVPFLGGPSRAGFSLLEVLCAVVVLAMAALGLSRTMVASSQLASATRERAVAVEAVRRMLEDLQDADFAQVFALYDANPANDPGGAGTAPGATFSADGLDATLSDADGLVGEIVFPVTGTQLREDKQLPQLGMPMDLDGNGAVDALDHATNYQLLPVLVRVAWRGQTAPMQVEQSTILAER
ncbi:MAG: prepilin-type N-terminal cleavage/methylation domain-containing protein [Planctomycetes bacterium]|nr:prepilin-type N-terminal cleavage/methylation domain-containing protein [Planctomycetota bacterium]